MSCQPGKFYSTTGLSRIFYCFRNTTIIQLGRPDNTECWIRNERRMLHYICVTGRRFAPLVLVLSGNSLDCRHSGWWRSFLLSPPPSAYATERRRRQQPLLPFNSEQNHQDVHHVMWLALLTGCIKSLLLLLLLVECGIRGRFYCNGSNVTRKLKCWLVDLHHHHQNQNSRKIRGASSGGFYLSHFKDSFIRRRRKINIHHCETLQILNYDVWIQGNLINVAVAFFVLCAI